MAALRRAYPEDRDAGDAPGVRHASEVARSLRRERTRRGLSLDDASRLTGLAPHILDGLETATADRSPATLKAVRRYADRLGLPGDRFALSLLDGWPDAPHNEPSGQRVTALVPAVGLEQTGRVPVTTAGTDTAGISDQLGPPTSALPTSVTPPDPRPRRSDGDGRQRAPLALRALVIVVVVAIVAGVVGLVVDQLGHHQTPTTEAGHTSSHTTVAPHGAAPTSFPSNGTGHGQSTRSTSPRSAATSSLLTQTSGTSTSADVNVGATRFVVTVTAEGGPSWVQASGPATASGTTATTTLFSQTLQAGQSQSFNVTRSITVEVGSSAGHLSVGTSGAKSHTEPFVPPGAPFTVTFHAGS